MRSKLVALAALTVVLVALGGLAGLALGVPWAFGTGSASPDGSLICSVQPSCTGGQVEVFRMSALANAHAGMPGGSAYGNVVCCGDVAGLGTDCTGTPHAVVLSLSAADNAHVASDGSYTTEVCLSGLGDDATVDCQYGASCDADYACLATLSGSTNAHVADCDGVDDYATKVCCQVTPDNCPTVSNPGQENTDATDQDGDTSLDEDPVDGVDNDADTLVDEDPPGDVPGDACDPDDDNDGYSDGDETAKLSDPLNASSTPEHCEGVDNDGDTDTDEGYDRNPANGTPDCEEVSGTDWDSDLYTNLEEQFMTTDELADCPTDYGTDAWPPDLTQNGVLGISDAIMGFQGKVVGPEAPMKYSRRADFNGDGFLRVSDCILAYLTRNRINDTCS